MLAGCSTAPVEQPPTYESLAGVPYTYSGTPPVDIGRMEGAFDYYLDYWLDTRTHWKASYSDIEHVPVNVVFDCTFRCAASPNGLCSGLNSWSRIDVAYYSLHRSVEKPEGWEYKILPRTKQDIYHLSGNKQVWLDKDNEYYWCEEDNLPMPAMLHEWDHIIFNPHDPEQLEHVTPKEHTFSYP